MSDSEWREVTKYDASSKRNVTHVFRRGSNRTGQVVDAGNEIWKASVGTSPAGNWFSKEEAISAVKKAIREADLEAVKRKARARR